MREWSLPEYHALLRARSLPPLFVGLTLNNDKNRSLKTIVSLHEPRLQLRFEAAQSRPLAILACFNEADIISETIEHWISQGCDLHIIDNWSTDGTWPIIQELEERYGHHITLERFPIIETSRSSWRDILERKEEIALSCKERWIIHTDADEIRESSFGALRLADAMHMVEKAGWNRISFTVLNHRPTNGLNRPGFVGGSKG